jgi:hypothetical protein
MLLKTNPNFDNERTPLRSYTKAELSLRYNPEMSEATARQHLRRWIYANPGLMEALQQAGYNPRRHSFTPREVALIFEYLGEP